MNARSWKSNNPLLTDHICRRHREEYVQKRGLIFGLYNRSSFPGSGSTDMKTLCTNTVEDLLVLENLRLLAYVILFFLSTNDYQLSVQNRQKTRTERFARLCKTLAIKVKLRCNGGEGRPNLYEYMLWMSG